MANRLAVHSVSVLRKRLNRERQAKTRHRLKSVLGVRSRPAVSVGIPALLQMMSVRYTARELTPFFERAKLQDILSVAPLFESNTKKLGDLCDIAQFAFIREVFDVRRKRMPADSLFVLKGLGNWGWKFGSSEIASNQKALNYYFKGKDAKYLNRFLVRIRNTRRFLSQRAWQVNKVANALDFTTNYPHARFLLRHKLVKDLNDSIDGALETLEKEVQKRLAP